MSIIVKKFGGTSLQTPERIKEIAKFITKNKNKDDKLIIVVSAMGNKTNELLQLAKKVSPNPSNRELDMLLTAGERISMSLLSLALQNFNVDSISFTGSQSGIITNTNHGNAQIIDVKSFRIKNELSKNKIVIVAGFQGVSTIKEVTTLGRGGSDTSATAIACYMNADKCFIYTDVEGVYTADPRKVKNAEKIDEITYKDMLVLAKGGARVLHPRAVEFAMNYGINLEIRSSFEMNKRGTTLVKEIDEKKKICGIADKNNLTAIKININSENQLNEILTLQERACLEIFDQIFLDGKYLVFSEDNGKFLTLLKHKNIEYSIKKNLIALTIAGFNIYRGKNFIFEILQLLEKDIDLFSYKVNPTDLRLFFTLQNNDLQNILAKTHNFIQTTN